MMQVCQICSKKCVAKGYCSTHYKQIYRHGKTIDYIHNHGMAKTPFYNSWRGMKERTFKNKRYIKKGIKLCERWKIFSYFKNDMYESYLIHVKKHGARNTTIERINNNKGYSPENCRWATHQEQFTNKDNSRLITFKGQTKILCEWARDIGINHMALHYRIKKWGINKAFSIPKLNNKTRIKYGKLVI